MSEPTQQHATALRDLFSSRPPSGSDWLRAIRERAMADFTSRGFPSPKLEDWKYTDVRQLAQAYPAFMGNPARADIAGTPASLAIEDALHLVFVDGRFRQDLSSSDLPPGLRAGPLGSLSREFPKLFEKHFGALLRSSASGMVAVNTAFAESAVALSLPQGTELQRPVYIEHFGSSSETGSTARLIAELGPNSSATIVEHFYSSAPVITNAVSEIYCAAGSKLSYSKLQEEHPDSWHTAIQSIRAERDATLKTITIDSGSRLARNELHIGLCGAGASASASGLLLADGDRHVESRISVEHAAPSTTSRERYRAILADTAKGVFNGRILVQQDAQQTSADLTNRNLLLDRGAEINTKPELEIYADDVKCAHGSTTGQLDRTALFYLLSRGLAPTEAHSMLVRAFAAELLTDLDIEALAGRAVAAMNALRLDDL